MLSEQLIKKKKKEKDLHSNPHCVDDRSKGGEGSEIFYLALHTLYLAPDSKGIPSFLFDLSIPQTWSECKAKVCTHVCMRSAFTFRLLRVINTILGRTVLTVE